MFYPHLLLCKEDFVNQLFWEKMRTRIFFLIFAKFLQKPLVCSKDIWHFTFPLLSTSCLSKSVWLNDEPLVPSGLSSLLSKYEVKSPSSLVKSPINCETWPTYLFFSNSSLPVVESVAILKAKAKTMFTNHIGSSTFPSPSLSLKSPPFFLRVISNSKNLLFFWW